MSWEESKGIRVDRMILKSKAFEALNGMSVKVLLLFLARRRMAKSSSKKWIIINNGKIVFPYKEAEKKFGINRSTFTRAIDDLIDKGFISIIEQGNGFIKGATTKYAVIEKWRHYGKGSFDIRPREKDSRCASRNKHSKQNVS